MPGTMPSTVVTGGGAAVLSRLCMFDYDDLKRFALKDAVLIEFLCRSLHEPYKTKASAIHSTFLRAFTV